MAENSSRPIAADRTGVGRPNQTAIRLGSEQHKQLFCRMLLDTHDPYRPAVIPWPELDDAAFTRLTGLPVWNMAVRVEGTAAVAVRTYAETLRDPLLREAVTLDGNEEARHKEVLGRMIAFYGIPLEPEPDYPRPADPELAFLRTGYGECLDSFFAFGLFEIARRSGFFPSELVETFEPVIQEECRHILFFVNWLAWHRRQLSWPRRILFDLRCLSVFLGRVKERIKTAKGVGGQKNFTATSSKAIESDLKPRDLFELCLAENDRRMARYDRRLIRPRLVPALVKIALKFMPA
jgi:hypothetical protein